MILETHCLFLYINLKSLFLLIMMFFYRHYAQRSRYDSNTSGQSSFVTSPAADSIEKEALPRYEPIPFSASMNESTPTGITDHIAQGRNFSWNEFQHLLVQRMYTLYLMLFSAGYLVCVLPLAISLASSISLTQHVCSFHLILHSSSYSC